MKWGEEGWLRHCGEGDDDDSAKISLVVSWVLSGGFVGLGNVLLLGWDHILFTG